MDYRKDNKDVVKYEDIMHRTDLEFVLIDEWKMGVFDYARLKLNLHESIDLVMSNSKERNMYLVFENKLDAFWFKLKHGELCRK